MDHSIRIGGEAGQGIQTIGDTLSRFFARSGYHVFTHQDYESRVRGGHNFYQVRVSDKPLTASRDKIDILIAFDTESITRYENTLIENGLIIYDSSILRTKYDKPNFFDIPFIDLSVEKTGNKIMANSVAVGSVLGMFRMRTDALLEIFKEAFYKKGEDVIKSNIDAVNAGYDFSVKNCTQCSFISASDSRSPLFLIAGNEAIGLGAVASGLKFYSAYPMTPATGIMNYIADKEKEYGIIVEQAEDEISAINMALGASYAGVRAMTGTSGGGFALMVEGLSLAGITETPVVIAIAQRPGPATGLPTRTEQADLQFALYSGHGEFPRVIFAPGTPEQAFYITNKAFDLAEKYQIPVIILTDQYLADSQWTFEGLDLNKIKYIDYRIRGDAFKNLTAYKRHEFTGSGITPMGIPGDAKHLVVTDSDEHDEEGHIIEDAETRNRMVDKRLFRKLPLLSHEIAPPLLYGNEQPEIVLVGWGSTYGVIKEAVDILSQNPPSSLFSKAGTTSSSLKKRGEKRLSFNKIAMLHFSEIYPFPSNEAFDFIKILITAHTSICIENNASSQFARLTLAETGFNFKHHINKYDGRPYTSDFLINSILALLNHS